MNPESCGSVEGVDEVRAAERAEDCRHLHARLKAFAKQRAALDASEARCLVIAEEIEIWKAIGYTTMLAYLEGELGYGPHTAGERLRVAHALRELPLTAERLEAGELHHSAVRELTRVATFETETAWLEAAEGKNLRQIEHLVAGHRMGDLPDDEPDPDLELRKLTIEVTPATYALYRQARKHLDAQTGERLTEDAAMAMMCRGALGDSATASDHPPAQICYQMCPTCHHGTQDGAGIVVDIDAATVARVLCDAEVLADPSSPSPRTTATVTPRVRRQVLARDHHRCVVPGCRNARFLEIHHVTFQSHGGRHELSNLISICTAHHDLLHHGKLVIRGRPPALTFARITDEDEEIELTDRILRPTGDAM